MMEHGLISRIFFQFFGLTSGLRLLAWHAKVEIWKKMQLGFDYNYSHSKVKFNVNWIDNIIIQRISLFNTNIFCLGTSNDILFLNNIFITFLKMIKNIIKGVLSIHLCDRNVFMQIWVEVFVFQLFFFWFNVSWSIVHYIVMKWFICYIHECLEHSCILLDDLM
jgi:hypothetical protein